MDKSRISDRNSFETKRLVEEMLEATGFEGDFTLDIVTKETGDSKNVGTVHLRRGHVSGIEIDVQSGNRDTCYRCSLVWERNVQTAFFLDLSRRLGEKKTYWRQPQVASGEKQGAAPTVVVAAASTQVGAKAPGLPSKVEVMAFIVLTALGETWFSFGNAWSSIFIPRGLTGKKPVAQHVLKYLTDKGYLEKKGQRRWTRYCITALGKKAQKGESAAHKPVRPALPESDADLSAPQIQGLRLRSETFASAHVKVRNANDRIAELAQREQSLQAELRAVQAEKSAALNDKLAYEAVISDPEFRRDFDRYAALKKKG